jgi:hypothetical protein
MSQPAAVAAPLFLVGSERSGSTLLRLMLDHHPQIAFHREFDFAVANVSDAGGLPAVPDYLELLQTFRDVGFTIDASLDYRSLVDSFLRQKQALSGGKPHVGATVHRHFNRLRFLWPDARYLHLVRDPRDVARSVVQKGWAGNIYQGTEMWIRAEECWDSTVEHLAAGQAVEVRYEALVSQPEAELSRLCAFIGVEYSAEMLAYSADARQYPPPDAALALQWRRRLSAEEVGLVEARTGLLMASRGYPPSGHPVPGIGRVRHHRLLTGARARRLSTRIDLLGLRVVAMDMAGRRLGIRPLARRAQARINAIEQRKIDQEAAGERAPSANIAVAGRAPGEGPEPGDGAP